MGPIILILYIFAKRSLATTPDLGEAELRYLVFTYPATHPTWKVSEKQDRAKVRK